MPDGKIASLPFLGLRQGRRMGGAIKGNEEIEFCSVAYPSGAIVQKPEGPNTYNLTIWLSYGHLATMAWAPSGGRELVTLALQTEQTGREINEREFCPV